jgi:hypothetical protein
VTRMLRRLWTGRRARWRAEIRVAVFGKHPAWADHMDDIGLATERLAEVRRNLYVQGVGGNIGSGAWAALAPAERVDVFDHVFVWRWAEDVVIGRLCSEADAKGRADYPLVACAQCSGVALGWSLVEGLARLEQALACCAQAGMADGVRSAAADAQAALQLAAAGVQGVSQEDRLGAQERTALADCPELGPDRLGLHRTLYQVLREMGARLRPDLALPDDVARLRTGSTQPVQMRVPVCASSTGATVVGWLDMLLSLLDPASPIVMVLGRERPWMDILVGEPTPEQWFCLKARTSVIPLSTDIPYTLGDAFQRWAHGWIESWRSADAQTD